MITVSYDTFSFPSGSIFPRYTPVILESGLLVPASALDPTHSQRLVFLTLTAAEVLGQFIRTILIGIIENPEWNWDLTRPIFIGDGELTQIAPLAGAAFVRILGLPSTPTIFHFQPQSTILLGT